jgi:hydroxymethylpyrimidine pyrophosphatase-like HAD family hydrolase
VLPEETLVAGDGFNDRHMFDPGIAKWMVCPANAGSYIKALVRKHGGIVSRLRYSRGIVRGAEELIKSAETCGRTFHFAGNALLLHCVKSQPSRNR